ncbi:MAG: helicase C-terminal domain-containing protein [Candidatus Neomarinimicrobiota bacterium]|nr:helicase C-terminal domain-containing protein [Candidatus Neomarinimicrobiota bacterium]
MDRAELLDILNLSTFIAFDLETTGLDPVTDHIIEIAAIRFVKGRPKDRYVTLVNPDKHIPVLVTQITGITNNMVRTAPKEAKVIDDFLEFLGDAPLVAHNICFDWEFLSELCKRYERSIPNGSHHDTLQLGRSLFFDQPVFNLGALSEYCGLSSSGSHRAEKDTENCGAIFLDLVEELASYSLERISKVLSLVKPVNIPNKSLYVDLGNVLTAKGDLKKGLTQSKISREPRPNTFQWTGSHSADSLRVEDVFGANGLLKDTHPQYEHRTNQMFYAEFVEDILLDGKKFGVIEAGTGLGKSLAYLFSAFKRAPKSETMGPTIIACHTKHLQDQLFYKDLPLLAKTMDISVGAIMLKGRKNYICRTRFDWLISESSTLDEKDIEALIPILFWLEWTRSGDMSECSGFSNARRLWLQSAICSDSGFCTGEICARNDGCFYGNVRKVLYQSPIIIANHSLLLTEAEIPGFLPEFNTVIVDEAHNLVRSAQDHFKIELHQKSINNILQMIDPTHPRSKSWNNILNAIERIEHPIGALRDKLSDAVGLLQKQFDIFMSELKDDNRNRFDPSRSYQEKPIIYSLEKVYAPVHAELDEVRSGCKILFSSLDRLRKTVLELDPSRVDYTSLHSVFDRGIENVSDLMNSIILLTENQQVDWVYWMEGVFRSIGTPREDLRISLHASPIDMAESLTNKFFNRMDHCVLTSATIRVDDTFDYFLTRTGLDEWDDLVTAEFSSPFYYNDQVTFYQYGGSKGVTNDAQALADIVYHVHHTFQRRTMVLFTSVRMLTNVAGLIRDKPGGRDLPLFAQSRGASKPAIINGMYQHRHGLLFGTNSFWEGVDLPGDLLEILIVVKLPFDVPSDPLIRSYSDLLDQSGENSFMSFSVPECAIRFRQGFGRLIRTTKDSGIFFSLDNRLVTKRYGEIFLQSIPVEPEIFSDISTLR